MVTYFVDGLVSMKKLYKDDIFADYMELYINEIIETKLWFKDHISQCRHILYSSGALKSTT